MKAACQFFSKCSGCSLQQFPYVKQLHDKTRDVRQTLGRFVAPGAEVSAVILPVVGSPAEFGYRTSSKLCLGEDEFGRRSIGLYARGSKKVVDIPGCPIHHPALNKLTTRLFGPGKKFPAPFYNHGKKGFQPGRLKFLTIRFSPEAETFGLVLSHTGVPRGDLEAWAASQRWENISLYESKLSRDDEDLVISRDVRHLAGDPIFSYQLNGRVYKLDPMAFFQANSSLVTQFIEHITHDLQGDSLLDLYGGFGSYSLQAASRFRKVQLVEANPHATEAGQRAAADGGIQNIQCSAAGVEEVLKKLLRTKEACQVTHMIVNPPRGGLSPSVLQSLSLGGWDQLQKLHYVSCNMETLQRDLQVLIRQGGFRLESVTPFDMFPQTEHIEVVAKLRYEGLDPAKKPNPTRAVVASDRSFVINPRDPRGARKKPIRSETRRSPAARSFR